MTKKTYEKKMRYLWFLMRKHNNGNRDHRVGHVQFGSICRCGKYKGRKIDSYKMAYDACVDLLKDALPELAEQ